MKIAVTLFNKTARNEQQKNTSPVDSLKILYEFSVMFLLDSNIYLLSTLVNICIYLPEGLGSISSTMLYLTDILCPIIFWIF